MARYVSLNNLEVLVKAQRDKFDEIDNEFANVYKEFESNKAKVSAVLRTHQADIMALRDQVSNLQRSYLISIIIIVALIVMVFALGLIIGYKNGRENTENKNLDNATTAVAAVNTSVEQFNDNYNGEVNEI